MSFDPLFALLVIAVLVLPYLIWLIRADTFALPPWPALDRSRRRARCSGANCSAACCWRWPASLLLAVLNSGWFARRPEDAPIIYRPPVDPLARRVRLFLRAGAGAARQPDRRPVRPRPRRRRRRRRAADVGTRGGDRDRRSSSHLRRQRVLRAAWAAAVVAPGAGGCWSRLIVQPWTGGRRTRRPRCRPATIAQFFGDSFERRTNRPLQAVAGDPQLAALIATGRRRGRICCSTPRRNGRHG